MQGGGNERSEVKHLSFVMLSVSETSILRGNRFFVKAVPFLRMTEGVGAE
jgi:hypothetical protein